VGGSPAGGQRHFRIPWIAGRASPYCAPGDNTERRDESLKGDERSYSILGVGKTEPEQGEDDSRGNQSQTDGQHLEVPGMPRALRNDLGSESRSNQTQATNKKAEVGDGLAAKKTLEDNGRQRYHCADKPRR
jgi:hypothetical protein